MIGRIIVVSGVIFCCGFAWDRYRRRARAPGDGVDPGAEARFLEECLLGVWSEPRQLIADVQRDLAGPAQEAARHADRLVEVALTPQAQRNAWAAARHLATEGTTEDRAMSVRIILQHHVAPRCDWTGGYAPYQQDPRFRDVYESVALLLDLAELSLKYGDREPVQENGALVSPGWVHSNPAPSGDLRNGDFVEVLVDRYSSSPEDAGRYGEWAWVRLDSVSMEEAVVGVVTYDAPPGAAPNTLRNTESHGFGPGTPVTVPRRCIHRVVHGR
jgi:hypothetical protein